MAERVSEESKCHDPGGGACGRNLPIAIGVPLAIVGCDGPTDDRAKAGAQGARPERVGNSHGTQTDGHLWDTEDPGAGAPSAPLLVVALAAGALYLLLRFIPRRRVSGPFRLSDARRTQVLVRHRARSAVEEPTTATQFPGWVTESGLVETIHRIANDPTSYRAGTMPTDPGLYVAQVRMVGPGGDAVIVKVIVDATEHEVVTAHPGGAASFHEEVVEEPPSIVATPTSTSRDRRMQLARDLLEQACLALPAEAAAYDTENPHHPDSIGNLAYARELMDQEEFECALYAVATIAREVRAGPECWAALASAARELRLDARQRARAALR